MTEQHVPTIKDTAQRGGEPEQFCVWTKEGIETVWEATCKSAEYFAVIGPIRYGWKFCLYCGRKIKEEKP